MPITVAVIIVTGVIGNMLAETVCRVFKIYDPVAKGIAIGSSSHAIGTAKAMEMGGSGRRHEQPVYRCLRDIDGDWGQIFLPIFCK